MYLLEGNIFHCKEDKMFLKAVQMKFLSIRSFQYPGQTRARWTRSDQFEVWALELQSTVHKDFAIMERPLLEIGTPGQRS